MIISKNEYDENYPYVISDTWGDQISCDLEDLLNLKNFIEEILKTNNPLEELKDIIHTE